MLLFQALRYPFQGKGSFRRILILALLQLIPIVGQLILLGYGLDIVRAMYTGQTSLPPIRGLQALTGGLRIVLAALLYMTPILITVTLSGASTVGLSVGGSLAFLGIFLSVGLPLLLVLMRVVYVRRKNARVVQQSRASGGRLRPFLSLVPILVVLLAILGLRSLIFNSGINFGSLNGASITLCSILALLILLIVIALYVGSVRYAVENKGLFDATTNARLMFQNRAATGMLFLNVIMLTVITAVVTGIGFVLVILPGLFMYVTCSLALWYLLARYGIQVGIRQPVFAYQRSEVPVQ